jgi:methionine synthase II (cobalamin-independent)
MSHFTPNCLPVLIGSLPGKDHQQAIDLIFAQTPAIPIWPQMSAYPEEGMIKQFLPGMPGLAHCDDLTYIEGEGDEFEAALLAFFEEYLMVTEGAQELDESRFTLSPEVARGFHLFLERARQAQANLTALKGQITGPLTFCTGVVDHKGRAIFYDDQLRDAAVKLLALKARWQARKMSEILPHPMVFFDEPAMAGFGSSAFITISPEDVIACFKEVFEAVHQEGALTGVHVCANTEWPVVFDSGVDVISFDSFSFFDRFILYPEHLKAFFDRGGILASGIVPTTEDLIIGQDADSLTAKWQDQAAQLVSLGISSEVVYQQSLITPSCGTGTISPELACRVLELTRAVSDRIRALHGA